MSLFSKCAAPALAALGAAALVACGGADTDAVQDGVKFAASAKGGEGRAPVQCRGEGDRPETALQGQVPAAMRAAGFKGFSCNLTLVGQLEGEGANWSSATYFEHDRRGAQNEPGPERANQGRTCFYYASATPQAAAAAGMTRANPGVPVLDITNPKAIVRTTSLTTPGMLDPWESLRVHDKRQILIADNGQSGGGGPEIDIYDISGDCRSPQLIVSAKVGTGLDGGIVPPATPPQTVTNIGHEGNISPDGLTYYIGDIRNRRYNAVDVSVLSKPKMISTWLIDDLGVGATIHGLSISNDGNRAYAAVLGSPRAGEVADPNAPLRNGFVILDTSEVQARKPGAQMKVVSTALFKDGAGAQHTIEIKIGGKPYVVMVDEAGSGGFYSDAAGKAACAAGLSPFPMARLFDISNERAPKQVVKFGLEINDPKNCAQTLPDVASLAIFTYGSHYCSVDNRDNATALACGYFNSGIRVFDIRDVSNVREIAYFNPPSASRKAGSNHATIGQWREGGPDWCASRLDFDHKSKQLITTCQDNGALVLRFAPNTWPFPQSTPSRNQN